MFTIAISTSLLLCGGTHLGKCGGGGADDPLGKHICTRLHEPSIGDAHELGLSDGNSVDDDLLEAVRDKVSSNITEVAGVCFNETFGEGRGHGNRFGLGDRSAVEYEGCPRPALCTGITPLKRTTE